MNEILEALKNKNYLVARTLLKNRGLDVSKYSNDQIDQYVSAIQHSPYLQSQILKKFPVNNELPKLETQKINTPSYEKVTSNDATTVRKPTSRTINPHLLEKPVHEGKLSTIGTIASAIPFAVAAYPVLAGSQAALPAIAKTAIGTGASSYFIADGIRDIYKGHPNWETALKLTPGIGLTKSLGKAENWLSAGEDMFSSLPKGVQQRAIETALRTSNRAEGLPDLKQGIKYIYKNDKPRLKSIGKYILTGKKTGEKGYYNSFSPIPEHYYKGLHEEADLISNTNNDLIDAFVYGKEIDPSFGVTRIIPQSDQEYRPWLNFIRRNYYNKKDIPIYEMDNELMADYVKPVHPEQVRVIKSQSVDEYPHNSDALMFDLGGTSRQAATDLDTGTKIYRNVDLWKFHPKTYSGRYRGLTKKFLPQLGLRIVDKVGTPVMVRTPWYQITGSPYQQFLNYYK